MTFWKWSRTASTNATADSTCPFPEGMNPGALNDGTRGMMAAAAKYRDDISGATATTGTGTAYVLATYQGYDSLTALNGARVAFTPHTTNGAAATLNVDGQGAKPLRGAVGQDLSPGSLIQGVPYECVYNNADGAFYVSGGTVGPLLVPIGGLIPFFGSTSPNGNFIIPQGQGLSRTAYAALFALIGTTYGSGDGSTTFNVPNLTNRAFIQAGTAAGLTTTLGQQVGNSSFFISQNQLPNVALSASVSGTVSVSSVGSPGGFLRTDAGVLGVTGALQPGTTIVGGNNGAVASQVFAQGENGLSGSTSSINGGGAQQATSLMQPSQAGFYLLRVL